MLSRSEKRCRGLRGSAEEMECTTWLVTGRSTLAGMREKASTNSSTASVRATESRVTPSCTADISGISIHSFSQPRGPAITPDRKSSSRAFFTTPASLALNARAQNHPGPLTRPVRESRTIRSTRVNASFYFSVAAPRRAAPRGTCRFSKVVVVKVFSVLLNHRFRFPTRRRIAHTFSRTVNCPHSLLPPVKSNPYGLRS